MCLGIEPGAAGWKARMNPLSYGGTPYYVNFLSTSMELVLRANLVPPNTSKFFTL